MLFQRHISTLKHRHISTLKRYMSTLNRFNKIECRFNIEVRLCFNVVSTCVCLQGTEQITELNDSNNPHAAILMAIESMTS